MNCFKKSFYSLLEDTSPRSEAIYWLDWIANSWWVKWIKQVVLNPVKYHLITLVSLFTFYPDLTTSFRLKKRILAYLLTFLSTIPLKRHPCYEYIRISTNFYWLVSVFFYAAKTFPGLANLVTLHYIYVFKFSPHQNL